MFVQKDLKTFAAVMRLWGIVLLANLLGTTLVARLLSLPGVFDPATSEAMRHLGIEIVHSATVAGVVKAVFAGWHIALMVWVLPSARSARLFVILILTYVVSLGHFPNIVAGSVEPPSRYSLAMPAWATTWADFFCLFYSATRLAA